MCHPCELTVSMSWMRCKIPGSNMINNYKYMRLSGVTGDGQNNVGWSKRATADIRAAAFRCLQRKRNKRPCLNALGSETWDQVVEYEDKKKVVVVGGGAGGLACAGRLAKAGLEVTLLEKNSLAGGRLQSEYIDGWRFDTGPSLLLFPKTYMETFEHLGIDHEECLELKRVVPAAYRVFFSDGSSIDLLDDPEDMKRQLEGIEKGAGEGYEEFLEMAKRHLEIGMPYFIERDFTELSDAKGLLDLLPKATSLNPWQLLGPYDLVLRQFFKSDKIRSAFAFQTCYVGLTPYTAPGVFSLLAGTEMNDGVFYPIGGFGKIRDSLFDAAIKHGVKMMMETEVKSIAVDPKSNVCGVKLVNGTQINADIVVCNRDLPASYELLESMGDTKIEEYAAKKSSKLGSLAYSNGVLIYCWCINRKIDNLLHHNVFVSDNRKKSWNPARSADELQQFPNFYVHVPSRTDATAAPDGCESVMVLLPVANLQLTEKEKYPDMVRQGKECILKSLETSGVKLGQHIVAEKIVTPDELGAKYGLKHGAAFGLSHGLNQLSLFRPSNKEDICSGLYFTGASTRPGNGVPLCFISAKLTAERILKDNSCST
eukprot:jgi/Picsp_1/88/NSC_00088-R1_phytoene dehydrogenase